MAADDFFDADYYRLLEPFHPETEARREAAALREMLGLAQDDRILDLGCGWGRHLRLLVEAGHDATGVDRSLPLLAYASAPPAAPPRLVGADMLRLPFAEASFDVVLNLATSLGLFLRDEPAARALREAGRVLRPGGTLMLEGMHRDDVVAGYASRDAWTLEDGTTVRARRRFDALGGISHEVLRWRGPGGEGSKRHSLRIRSATELAALVESVGLTVRSAFGDWHGAAFTHDSDRLILVAERL